MNDAARLLTDLDALLARGNQPLPANSNHALAAATYADDAAQLLVRARPLLEALDHLTTQPLGETLLQAWMARHTPQALEDRMGNSVTRATVRRRAGLHEAVAAALNRPGKDAADLADEIERQLAARGLTVADVGGNRADDDGAHRMPILTPAEDSEVGEALHQMEEGTLDPADVFAGPGHILQPGERTVCLLEGCDHTGDCPGPPDAARGPRLIPRRDPHLCWRLHPGTNAACQLPDGHDL